MIVHGECLEKMTAMADNSISCIVTDPPYGLKFMNKDWDHCIPGVPYWKEALRITKPGGHLLAFGGTRTYHRLTCAIEDAGWEIRDCIIWCFGQGLPKSHNFGCKCTGDPVPYIHEKTTESPTESSMRSLSEDDISSPISTCQTENEVMLSGVQKQDLQNFRPLSREGIEIRQEPCLERGNNLQAEQGKLYRTKICEMPDRISCDGTERRLCDGASNSDGQTPGKNPSTSRSCSSQGSQYSEQPNRKSGTFPQQSDAQADRMETCQKCGGLIAFKGYGTSLKPAYEPIIMALKKCVGTFAKNAEMFGQAGINIDACRISFSSDKEKEKHANEWDRNWSTSPIHKFDKETGNHPGEKREIGDGPKAQKGRWPANLIFDEESAEMLDGQSGFSVTRPDKRSGPDPKKGGINCYSGGWSRRPNDCNDSGGASRFFYCAKASSSERGEQNNHPTVKPLKLMTYLIKLVMPPKDGLLLDPFAGSGSTLIAAKNLGINAIGIEQNKDYCDIANARLGENAPETK